LHYYVPRRELIDRGLTQLVGENPNKGGHYITVWAPRQTGKTWVMQQVMFSLRSEPRCDQFDVVKVNLQVLKTEENIGEILGYIVAKLAKSLDKRIAKPATLREFEDIFTKEVLDKPLILILDEFDALRQAAISDIAGGFRNIYIQRQDQVDRPSAERDYLLHGLALVGVRAVLGIESQTGSPFNVQRSLHIPNLTSEEVEEMFRWYERESGQEVEQAVIDRVFYETRGQPGLTSWLGELLTETYNDDTTHPITLAKFEEVYSLALNALPNNNVINIISKAKQEPYQDLVLELFRTNETIPFRYDDPQMNFLYLNGVIDWETAAPGRQVVKFPCPFVQKRLFNYFAHTLFRNVGRLYPLFEDLDDTITEDSLNVKNLLRRYEGYLRENRDWLLKDVPRRTDLRPYEAVYHFNLYRYLANFLQSYEGRVTPEFPTGNGKVDLLIEHGERRYGVEVKSYTNRPDYKRALRQAARYGQQLELAEMTLAFFVETIDETNRAKYEVVYEDKATGVTVRPVFVVTGA
jgi:hypothetical protein